MENGEGMKEIDIVVICPEHGRLFSPDDEHPTVRVRVSKPLSRTGFGLMMDPLRSEIGYQVGQAIKRHYTEHYGE